MFSQRSISRSTPRSVENSTQVSMGEVCLWSNSGTRYGESEVRREAAIHITVRPYTHNINTVRKLFEKTSTALLTALNRAHNSELTLLHEQENSELTLAIPLSYLLQQVGLDAAKSDVTLLGTKNGTSVLEFSNIHFLDVKYRLKLLEGLKALGLIAPHFGLSDLSRTATLPTRVHIEESSLR